MQALSQIKQYWSIFHTLNLFKNFEEVKHIKLLPDGFDELRFKIAHIVFETLPPRKDMSISNFPRPRI